MNHEQAVERWQRGLIHPHCPVCGHTQLTVGRKTQIKEDDLWRSYVCQRCKQEYTATVREKPVDIRV